MSRNAMMLQAVSAIEEVKKIVVDAKPRTKEEEQELREKIDALEEKEFPIKERSRCSEFRVSSVLFLCAALCGGRSR